jgi:hypothetical protein
MRNIIEFAVLAVVVGMTPAALAQRSAPCWGKGGLGMGGPYARMYDPSTVETLQGTIVSIDEVPSPSSMAAGVHAMVKTDKETTSVHLGPAWFVNSQDIKLQKGDTVEVRGSRITYEGKPAVIAAEVKKGGVMLKLRETDGTPLWAGGRRRSGS